MNEEELKQSGMHGHGFYDSKWNNYSISKWLDTWYSSRPRPTKQIWNRFPKEKASDMLDDWMNCMDKSDYRTPLAGCRKASWVQDCLEHYEDSLALRPAPQKRVRELVVTQPEAPAPKKAKAAAPKPRKPMQWDKVTGGHNGQFFEWDSRQRKMVSTDDDISEPSFHLNLNEKDGDAWDDIVWRPNDDGTRRTLVIQPAYSFRTAYGAYGTTGHYLIIKPDQDECTRRQLYSAIERAFVEDKESDGTANPKPRLCLSWYNHHPFLEGLNLSGRFFEVDGKKIPVLQCRWGS
jgi:hypothetical protein